MKTLSVHMTREGRAFQGHQGDGRPVLEFRPSPGETGVRVVLDPEVGSLEFHPLKEAEAWDWATRPAPETGIRKTVTTYMGGTCSVLIDHDEQNRTRWTLDPGGDEAVQVFVFPAPNPSKFRYSTEPMAKTSTTGGPSSFEQLDLFRSET